MDEQEMKPTFTIGTKSFEEFVHAVVRMVKAQVELFPIRYIVNCRRRPGRKKCGEPITAFADPESGNIHYRCPKCGDSGSISNWRNAASSITF